MNNSNLNFFIDSSNLGFGACFGNQYVQGKFPNKWKIPKRDIQFLELYPIYLMVELFAPQLVHMSFTFVTDNLALAGSINKQSSRNKYVMRLLRPMVLVLMKNDILFSAETKMSRLKNTFCDKLSRFQIPEEIRSNPTGGVEKNSYSSSLEANELEGLANQLITSSYRPVTILNYQHRVRGFAIFLDQLKVSRIMPVLSYYVALYIAKLVKDG